ncbi:MAG: hypothetical protein R6V02_00615 [Candidatus Aminicenantes bacterium]
MAIMKDNRNKMLRIISLSMLACFLVLASVACQQEEDPEIKAEPMEEGVVEFEGSVKVAVGQYIYIPEARGFDVVLKGDVQGGTEILLDQAVRGSGKVNPDIPSMLVADFIEVQQNGTWTNVYTRTDESMAVEDYVTLQEREQFQQLEDLSYDKKEVWEDKEKVKIYGALEQTEEPEEGEDAVQIITVLDPEDKQEIGKVLVDNMTDFAKFYIQKLSVFDEFWFYVNIKETVDWSVRSRSREMFHADVLFAGLF